MSSASELISAIPQEVQQLVAQLGPETIAAIVKAQAQVGQPAKQLSKKSIKAMKKQSAQVATAVKNTRPLNSWIAFRCEINFLYDVDQLLIS